MTQIIQEWPKHLSIILYLSLLFEVTLSLDKTGFSVELIPIISKPSLFFKQNLSDFEITNKLNQFDRHDESRINQTALVRPPVNLAEGLYFIKISIGTGRGKRTYNFQLSIGYGVMWTQCQPCHPCFQQSAPMFDPRLSPTFHPVSCADSLCRPPLFYCVDGKCVYQSTYDEHNYMRGYLARESITIGDSQPIPMIPLGCTDSSQISFQQSVTHGVVGMNMNPASFIMQIAGQNSGVFSYCLVPPTRPDSRSFLRFGTDINQPRQHQTVPLLRYPSLAYYVQLQDVSINGRRMVFGPGTFDRSPRNEGFRIDTISRSTMIAQAHARVASYIIEYFQGRHVPWVSGQYHNVPYAPCFQRVAGVEHQMPTMTLHFSGGVTFHISPEQLFVHLFQGRVFCFAIESDQHQTILGAHLQADKWMKFDTKHMLLSFAHQDCAQHS